MTTRTTTVCDGCLLEMGEGFKWELSPPGSLSFGTKHFHDLQCLHTWAARELGKPKVVPLRKPGILHDYTPFEHKEPEG